MGRDAPNAHPIGGKWWLVTWTTYVSWLPGATDISGCLTTWSRSWTRSPVAATRTCRVEDFMRIDASRKLRSMMSWIDAKEV
jgi:hypothetical protein